MVKTTQRLVGGGVGLSYESVSRDMSQVNYSSARQGLLEDQKTYRMLQRYLIDHFCDEVYGEWLDWMILSGQLQIPGYFSDRDRYLRHIWIASGGTGSIRSRKRTPINRRSTAARRRCRRSVQARVRITAMSCASGPWNWS